jgi:hypothetical protein
MFKAGTPIAAYNSVGSNLVQKPPRSYHANEASGSGLPKEGQPISGKHSKRLTDSPPTVKKKRQKPISNHQSLNYPRDVPGDRELVLALHVRQHKGAPLTHLIATTDLYTGSQRFAPIPKLLPVLAITQSHLILGRMEELYSLADAVDNLVKEEESIKAIQVGKYLQCLGVMDDDDVHLKTPWELRVARFQVMEVTNSRCLWAKWSVFKANQPQLVLLTSRTSSLADGFEIHPSPPEMVPSSSS